MDEQVFVCGEMIGGNNPSDVFASFLNTLKSIADETYFEISQVNLDHFRIRRLHFSTTFIIINLTVDKNVFQRWCGVLGRHKNKIDIYIAGRFIAKPLQRYLQEFFCPVSKHITKVISGGIACSL